MLDVFGGYDILASKPIVLTRIRQGVSAGKCVAGMISPPRQHTSCSSKVFSASFAIANLCHRARTLWVLENPCDSWLWDVPTIKALAGRSLARPGPWRFFLRFWITLHEANVVSGWKRVQERLAPYCSQNVLGQVDVAVFQDKNMFIQMLPHHAQSFALHVTSPALSR